LFWRGFRLLPIAFHVRAISASVLATPMRLGDITASGELPSRLVLAFAAIFLVLLPGCGGGAPPPPPVISVFVTPPVATVKVNAQLPFQASVQGTANSAVTWQVNSIPGGNAVFGTIDLTGLYTAPAVPPSPPSITVTATAMADATKSGSASVTVTIGVTVLPTTVSLNLNTAQCPVSQQFAATVAGSNNSNVAWSVNGLPAGDPNTTFGTIATTGAATALYTPPAAIPTPPQFNVTATAQADATQSASATVTVSAGGPSVDQAPQIPPIELGTSGGNANDQSAGACCSGTLGALVTRNGAEFILSNNHVLARTDQALPGEHIVQPGLVDTQCAPGATVATFSQAVKLQNGNGTAAADAALAAVTPGQVDPSGAILQLGPISCGLAQPAPPANTIVAPAIGMAVAKSGRSTGLTCGTISAVAVDDVPVSYPTSCGSNASFVVTFNNQVVIETASFSGPGDSGSLIVTADTAEATALLYGGDLSAGITLANTIQDVLAALPDPSNQALPAMVGGSTHPVAACGGSGNPQSRRNSVAAIARPLDVNLAHAKAVKRGYLAALTADPAVLGVGVGAGANPGEAAIVVFVERGKPHQHVPDMLDGVQVKTKAIGPLRAFDGPGCAARERESVRPGAISLR